MLILSQIKHTINITTYSYPFFFYYQAIFFFLHCMLHILRRTQNFFVLLMNQLFYNTTHHLVWYFLGCNDSDDKSICIFIFLAIFQEETIFNLHIFCSLLSDSA